MARVDPFVIQWPRKWTSDPEIGPVVQYLNRFLHDMFIRSGGSIDLGEGTLDTVESNDNMIAMIIANQESIKKRLDSLESDIIPVQINSVRDIELSPVVDLNKINARLNDLEVQL